MKLTTYAQAYRQNSVQTASPGNLILMLFDGALRFLNRALDGFEEPAVIPRTEIVHVNLMKTQAIINELQGSLNLDAGGDVARNLSGLYDYMRTQLRQANVRKESDPVRIVRELISELRDAWSAMLQNLEHQDSTPMAWVATAA